MQRLSGLGDRLMSLGGDPPPTDLPAEIDAVLRRLCDKERG